MTELATSLLSTRDTAGGAMQARPRDGMDEDALRAAPVLRGRELAWRLSTPGARSVRIPRGHILVRSGARFEGLYVIRAGSCMLVVTSPDGEEHIASFRLPGEVLGFEALASGVHEATVHALEPLTCWQLPAERVDALLRHDPAFAQTLVHTLSLETARSLTGMLMLGTMTADQRVASFLLDLAERYRQLGFPDSAFELRMTRAEIGRHLGISTETVSRVLSRFRADDLAIVNGRSVRLRDRAALGRILVHGN